MANPIVISHPLVQDKLSTMRSAHTDTAMFRQLMQDLALLLCYEATRNLPTFQQEVETPLKIKAKFAKVNTENLALVAILRAGTGMLDGALKLLPAVPVGHIGLYRDPLNYSVIEYYFKLPSAIETKHVFVLDPIIATGHSSGAAVSRIKESKPQSVTFISLVAAPEGLKYFTDLHPDVQVYTAAIDEKLNARNYIVPGLGDAGDRLFGTA
jgi:uracil phosphoribosyltransferase